MPTRVFWAWNANLDDEQDWVAPDNQRLHFGNNTALYKMYFTAQMPDRDQPPRDNVAMEFAKVMLPAVNRALFPERYAGQPNAAPSDVTPATAVDAAAAKDPTLTTPAAEPVPGADAGGCEAGSGRDARAVAATSFEHTTFHLAPGH